MSQENFDRRFYLAFGDEFQKISSKKLLAGGIIGAGTVLGAQKLKQDHELANRERQDLKIQQTERNLQKLRQLRAMQEVAYK